MRRNRKLQYVMLFFVVFFLTTARGVWAEENVSGQQPGSKGTQDEENGEEGSGEDVIDAGWKSVGTEELTRWQYIDEETKEAVTSAFRSIDGRTYYFDKEGYLLCDGLFEVENQAGAKDIYYAQKPESPEDTPANSNMGTVVNDQWILIGSKAWRYFGADGKAAALKTGWQKIDDEWYWLENGVARSGWLKTGAKWYYFSVDNGVMQIGWQKIGNKKYYLSGSKSDGAMKYGWQKIDGKWYYLSGSNNDGSLKTGWQKISGKWYYLSISPDDGTMKSGWQKINGKWYYLGGAEDGAMKYGWQKIGVKWYYLGGAEDGAMKYGWQKIDGKWYYLGDAEDGAMKTGWQKVGNYWYFMYSSGVMASRTWIGSYYVDSSGRWVEMDYVWPLTGYTYISSDFGYRSAPTAGASTNHNGIDIPAPGGTPIHAVADGKVITRGSDRWNGNYIKIDHGNGLVTAYLHMSGFAVSWGTEVKAGQIIGYVGTTGISTGNHLHLGFYENGTAVSPWNYLRRM